MWPFTSRKKEIEMSKRIDLLQSQIATLVIEVRELKADNKFKTKLILEAQDRISELEARLADQSTDAELDAVSASLSALLAELNPPAPVEAPVEPAPVEPVPAPVA